MIIILEGQYICLGLCIHLQYMFIFTSFPFSALSYNFAVDNYHPLASKKGFLPTPFLDETGHPRDFDWKPIEDEDLESKSLVIK